MRPIWARALERWVNHSAPSGPVAILPRSLNGVGTGNSVITPSVVMRPIWFSKLFCSMNHSAPSGPAVMSAGLLSGVGIGYSVITPSVVMRPILFLNSSVNHSAPSRPAVMPVGTLSVVGMLNSMQVGASASACSARLTTTHNETLTTSSKRRYRFCMRSPRKAPRAADCAKYLRRPTQQRRTAGRPRPERAGHRAERRDNWSLSRQPQGKTMAVQSNAAKLLQDGHAASAPWPAFEARAVPTRIELAIFAAMPLVSNWPRAADLGDAARRQLSEVHRPSYQRSRHRSP